MERMKAIFVLCAALAFALAPLATPGFNGFTASQFPVEIVQPPVQPAGYAFAIWGLIYVWLMASSVFGLLKRDINPAWDRVRWPLIVSMVLGAAWLGAAQTAPVMATLMIFVMLAAAVLALIRAPREDRWWLEAPLGLYAGWLSAAAFVALGVIAGGYGIAAPQTAALLCIAAAAAVALTVMLLRPGTVTYEAAVLWALAGIVAANAGSTQKVATFAAIAALVILFRGYLAARRRMS